jgi:hypothetical protein
MKSGIAALVQTGAWLSHSLDLEVLSLGRRGLDREDTCTLEMVGRNLEYLIKLDAGWCFLFACPLDQTGDPAELLFSIADGDQIGWKQISAVVTGLEQSGIKGLGQRPIELADGTIVIGG